MVVDDVESYVATSIAHISSHPHALPPDIYAPARLPTHLLAHLSPHDPPPPTQHTLTPVHIVWEGGLHRAMCHCSQVDVWGAAVVFYQLLFGQKPFGNDVSQQQLVQNQIILNAHKVKFPSKPLVSDATKACPPPLCLSSSWPSCLPDALLTQTV